VLRYTEFIPILLYTYAQRDGTPKNEKSSLYPILFVINGQRQVAAIKAIQAEYKIKQEI
jgi:hypothetical protein